tara:strand:+ start:591 stop:758 length:168 start_codon:yes stop_codon:yes gene_type:complete
MKTRKKIKCSKCEKDAVIIEDKIYYCGPCAVKQFIDRVHKRLRSKPNINNSKNNV